MKIGTPSRYFYGLLLWCACLSYLLFVIATSAHASNTTIAHWTFSQTDGPVVNDHRPSNEVGDDAKDRHSGWVGYSIDDIDNDEVDRTGSYARFNGRRNSIVLISDTNHTDFNPGNESLILSVGFAVDKSALSDNALAPKGTWNLVQKGRFNNSGGQWKLQIRKGPKGRLFFQCLINDNNSETRRAAAQVVVEKSWIQNDHNLKGGCFLDRQGNELKVDLLSASAPDSLLSASKQLPANFGDVTPRAGQCGTTDAFGGNIAIGNKPLCQNQKLDTNDAFRGAVYSLIVQRPQ